MIDLTKIKEPLGMLDEETRTALLAHSGTIQFFGQDGWEGIIKPLWYPGSTYRAKPQPREIWVHVWDRENESLYGEAHPTKESAEDSAGPDAKVVKFIEVIE